MSKSYYELLEVSKDATPDDIKKAYRRMAAKHHPDKGGDENKFKEIKIAYETLKDPEKRSFYDMHGTDRLQPRPGPSGVDQEEILRRAASIFTNMSGFGANVNINGDTIEQKISVPVDIMLSGGSFNFTYIVPVSGNAHTLQFRNNMGNMTIDPDTPMGHMVTKQEFGQTINLFLVPKSTPRYMSQGLDVITQADINVLYAMTGEKIEVRHPSGSTLKIEPPNSLKQGGMIRIPKKGLRSSNGLRGDFFVAMNLVVPSLTADQKMKLKRILKG